jgi:ferredoxin-NADP reductase
MILKIYYFFYSIYARFLKKYKIVVQKIIQVDDHTQTIWFNIPKGYKWIPGSSGLFTFKQAFSKFMIDIKYMRWMTVARNDEQTHLEITCRVPGSESLFKKEILKLKLGSEMLLYSVGAHCPLIRSEKKLVFLFMGIGSVTYKNLFESYEQNPKGIKSVTSINVDNHLTKLYKDQFPNVEKIYTKHRNEFRQEVSQYLSQSDTIFYLVGSEVFLKEMIEELQTAGIKNQAIIIDRSNLMRKKYYNLN